MKSLMWLGILMIVCWAILWLGIKIAAGAIHALLLPGIVLIARAMLQRRPA